MPMELPFESPTSASFAGLSAQTQRRHGASSDVGRADSRRRSGADRSGAFKVLVRAYIPRDFHPDALHRFGEVVRDFVNTYEFNMDKRPGRAGSNESFSRTMGFEKNCCPPSTRC